MRHIVITLPQKVKWADYKKELEAVKERKNVLNFRVPSLPKEWIIGARCYLVHNGRVLGYMEICGTVQSDGFTCDTSGKLWPAGKYIQRTGPFVYLVGPYLMKGFQGWKYFDPDAYLKEVNQVQSAGSANQKAQAA